MDVSSVDVFSMFPILFALYAVRVVIPSLLASDGRERPISHPDLFCAVEHFLAKF